MGFDYHPPLAYFENVLKGLAQLDPKPVIHLFGGEPTMREDLFEIIDMAHGKGLRVRLVTNGLRLANEEFCKRICDAGVPVLLAFDGRDPEIYSRLRRSPSAYDKKLKALENLRKFSRRKNTIMCCVARKINDKHMRDLIDFCHESRDFISSMHLIPLTETWPEGTFKTDICTTMEDVEQNTENGLRRKLVVIPKDAGRDAAVDRLAKAAEAGKIPDSVWASPGLPMLVFITAGLIIALFLGDLVWVFIRFLLG
jgi:uncharacterized radical SAM superfamily Fe-S cluster-containing enzyme